MRANLWRISLVISLVMSTVAVGVIVTASPEPVISVDPPVSRVPIGETFTVNIIVADISGEESLYGWQVTLGFDPNILNVTSVMEGPFLPDIGPTTWELVPPKINNTGGTVLASAAFFPYPPVGATGGGVLCNITFQVKAVGTTSLQLYNTILNTYDPTPPGKILPIYHTTVNGDFTNVHDIAVTSVTAFPTDVNRGDSVSINVTVANEGGFAENFTVASYWNVGALHGVIGTKNVENLEAGISKPLTFTWDTHVSKGIYAINVTATVLEGIYNPEGIDNDPSDNAFIDGNVNVFHSEAPMANFTFWPEKPRVNDTVTFNASASSDPDGIISWDWNFDDGSVGNGEVVTHVYAEAGTYKATLNVTDNDGFSSVTWKPLKVLNYPEAYFTYSPWEPLKNQPVTFNASESTPDGGNLIDPDSYFWDFGDQTNGTSMIVNHTYADDGTYLVNLTVTDDEGLTDSFYQVLEVSIKHDVVVDKVEIYYYPEQDLSYPYSVYAGQRLTVTVDVLNNGTETETFNVTAYYDDTTIGTLEVADLAPADQAPNNEKHIRIDWSTTDIPAGNYSVTAEVILDADNSTENNKATTSIEVKIADVAITKMTLSSDTVLAGELLNMSVSVENEGSGIMELCNVEVEFINATGSTVARVSLMIFSVEPGAEKEAEWTNLDPANPLLNVTVSPGTYTLRARVEHADEPEPFQDDNVLVYGTITIGASAISISASAETIAVGSTATINGSISPTRPSVTVTIQYRLGEDEDWTTIETVTTDENSTYSYDWTPEKTGTYEVKAFWEGDVSTLSSESQTLIITVNPAPPNVFLYVGVAVAMIVMAAIAVYLLRFRKPKPA